MPFAAFVQLRCVSASNCVSESTLVLPHECHPDADWRGKRVDSIRRAAEMGNQNWRQLLSVTINWRAKWLKDTAAI